MTLTDRIKAYQNGWGVSANVLITDLAAQLAKAEAALKRTIEDGIDPADVVDAYFADKEKSNV